MSIGILMSLVNFSVAIADTTYLGSNGIQSQIMIPAGCESCHVSGGALVPLDDYDGTASEIVDIIDRINRPPTGDILLMPRGGPKLGQSLLDVMAAWQGDGVPETSPAELAVTGHISPTDSSSILEGTLKENGRETSAYFKYWIGATTEPTNCPQTNSIFSGCTATTSAAGSGGNDIPIQISALAENINCSSNYNFRALSIHNGQFAPQLSPTMLGFTTNGGVDSDTDGVCQSVDNCPLVANPMQRDTNQNGIGDACDTREQLCFPIRTATGAVTIICQSF